ncbi:MAG TPA: hypothetical protein VFV32_01105 [Acidimicrobiales bacterium]|nr:hypothetical protein [Acidimicrobiales bacterium]
MPPSSTATRSRLGAPSVAGRVLGGAALTVLAMAGPAAADAAGPSDYRSEVRGIEPAGDGVEATIRGGDSFLEITVDAGRTVVVEGYSGEPYLQVLGDGTVQRNRLSSATYLNDDRKGAAPIPPEVQEAMADEGTAPEWETVADDGTYAWHDHRVHWMGDARPPVARGHKVGGEYDPWRVPITVDGTTAEITGTLTYVESVTPLPWLALAVVAAAALVALGRARLGLHLGAAALVVASALALVVGRAEWSSTPDSGGNPLLWALPLVALVTAVGALALARKGTGVVLALASVASLSGWALFRLQVLLKPVLPTDLPFTLDRATTGLALGVSVAAAVLAITSGALALPALADDDE